MKYQRLLQNNKRKNKSNWINFVKEKQKNYKSECIYHVNYYIEKLTVNVL